MGLIHRVNELLIKKKIEITWPRIRPTECISNQGFQEAARSNNDLDKKHKFDVQVTVHRDKFL